MMINSKQMFNDVLHDNYPVISKRCDRWNVYLDHDIELPELTKFVHFRSELTAENINRMCNADYFKFINELYNHIKNNEDMIEFWLI